MLGRFKILSPKLLLLFVSTLSCILVAELGIRTFYYFRESNIETLEERLERSKNTKPEELHGSTNMGGLVQASPYDDIVYELRPNLSAIFQGVPLRLNALGMRDRDYSMVKSSDVFRIVGIGDSVMFGWGVEERASYLALIEERLNSSDSSTRRYEVLNFSVPGYNTAMEVATYERKARAFKPDVVVIHFVDNDVGVPLFMERPMNIRSFSESFLLKFVTERVNRIRSGVEHNLVDDDLGELARDERKQVRKKYHYMLGRGGVRKALERLYHLTRQDNVSVVILTGTAGSKNKRVLQQAVDKWQFKLIHVKPFVTAYMEHNFPNASKSERHKMLKLSPSDAHPNELGHSIYAEALEHGLKELKLLPSLAH